MSLVGRRTGAKLAKRRRSSIAILSSSSPHPSSRSLTFTLRDCVSATFSEKQIGDARCKPFFSQLILLRNLVHFHRGFPCFEFGRDLDTVLNT